MQIRMHGRGGQGIVTLAELTAMAAFDQGHEAQAIPSFGSERMGAPVMSFCRISDQPIRTRQPVTEPDLVVVCDPTLVHSVHLFEGLVPTGQVIVNSARTVTELGLDAIAERLLPGNLIIVAGTELARQFAESTRANGVLLGAIAARTAAFSIETVDRVLQRRFGIDSGSRQAVAARVAYEQLVPAVEVRRA